MGELDDIRSILLRRENDRVAELEQRLDVHRRRAAELAAVMPDALRQSHEQGGLADALSEPMTDAVTHTIRDRPEQFAHALFPIMGPAIRRAIAEALKSFTQQINDAVEHSLTPRGLRWRIEAKRAGVSFSEYVLRQTRTFDVEQLFAIETASGKLLAHHSDAMATLKDKDAVSAMFSALQSFVQESFVGDNADGLEIAEISGKTVWAVHGTQASLAAVMSGTPPRALRRHLRDALDGLEQHLSKAERGGVDDAALSIGVQSHLEGVMQILPESTEPARSWRWFSASGLLLLLALVAIGWFAYRSWHEYHDARVVRETLATMPGVVVRDVQFSGEQGRVQLMVDPLVDDVAQRLTDAGIPGDRLTLETTSFLSVQPELVLQRAQRALSPPAGVALALQDGRVVVAGEAPAQWLQAAALKSAVLPGAEIIDFNVVASDSVDPAAVKAAALSEMQRLARDVERLRIRFVQQTDIVAEDATVVLQLAQLLTEIDEQAALAQTQYQLVVLGATDESGGDAINVPLRRARAQAVHDLLVQQHPPNRWLSDINIEADATQLARQASFIVAMSATGEEL
ncbi:MAG: hypothetical protein AAFO81_07205 [Pseudomonadota bacterium]